MKTTRRTFIKGSAGAGGLLLAKKVLGDQLETLVAASSKAQSASEEWIPTTCWIGKQDCGMLARVVNGRVVQLEGNPAHPRNVGTLCPKGVGQIMSLYDPNRIKTPLLRTNGKNEPGTFKQISWDEALELVAEKMNAARENGTFVWQKGRSKAKKFYDSAFVGATGATKLHHGAFCSDAGYRALEYTIGMHGVMHPDFRHTRYLLCWGWNVTNAGGNKFCWLTWPQQLVKAKDRGLKMVAIDPRARSAAHFADEWMPIKPGTDLPLALALCRLLIEQGTIDTPYLKAYTNSPCLVKEDGMFLRLDPEGDEERGKVLVWDEASGTAVAHGTEGSDPALEGEFTVNGESVKTAFTLFKEHVADSTPEWAAEICGVEADHIRTIAKEFGENAMIGSTIEVEGKQLPYRPVAIMAYHMAQQELGFQALRAMLMVTMLVGSVGAVGGQFSDFTWKEYKNWKKLDEISITDSPNLYLNKSKFYPINSNNSSLVAKVVQDPGKYDVEESAIPEMIMLHHVNPLGSFPSQADTIEMYKKVDFVAAIDPFLSKTADLFADVILPAATLEKYEGPISATDQYIDATAMRIPVMEPMGESRGEIDIYMDLCEKAGLLEGEDGYLAQVNGQLKLTDTEFALPLDEKPTVRGIFDNWAKSEGIAEGMDFFEKEGVQVKGPVAAKKYYPYAADEPFNGIYPHRLYGERLIEYAQTMQEMGADEIYWQDYTAYPTWRDLTMDGSPKEYDLYLVSYHKIEYKQSRTPIPLMVEMAAKQYMEMNPATAKAKGIEDGDEVIVESQNAVTGETRQVKVPVSYRESIRPDTVAMPHHYGEHTNHPWLKGQGATPNSLFFTGEGYVAQTADQTYCVKVKVTKA